MTPALLFCLVTLGPLAAAPSGGQPTLDVVVGAGRVGFVVSGPSQPFVGFVLGSRSAQLTHYLVDLPPLLTDGVLLGVGVGDVGMPVRIELDTALLPPGVRLFAQGVTLENGALASGDVERFAVDG